MGKAVSAAKTSEKMNHTLHVVSTVNMVVITTLT